MPLEGPTPIRHAAPSLRGPSSPDRLPAPAQLVEPRHGPSPTLPPGAVPRDGATRT
jgi:hypothetical protein